MRQSNSLSEPFARAAAGATTDDEQLTVFEPPQRPSARSPPTATSWASQIGALTSRRSSHACRLVARIPRRAARSAARTRRRRRALPACDRASRPPTLPAASDIDATPIARGQQHGHARLPHLRRACPRPMTCAERRESAVNADCHGRVRQFRGRWCSQSSAISSTWISG